MNIIKRFKKETMVVALSVILLTVASLSFSYAIFFDINSNSLNQTINSGSLSIAFSGGTSAITNNSMIPMTDSEGLAGTSVSTLYIQNNSTEDNYFNINIGYDYEAFTSAAGYTAESKLIPMEYVKIAIFEYDTVNSTAVQISDVLTLDSVMIDSVNQSNPYNNMYTIYTGEIEKSSSGNNAKTYTIKIWLDEFSPENLTANSLYMKVHVESNVTAALTNYSISGNLKDSSNSNIANAKISLNNNSFTTATDANGNFTLDNIREGKYNVNFILENGTVGSGSLVVSENTTLELNKYLNSHTVLIGNGLDDIAYTYNTTIKALKIKNNIAERFFENILNSNQIINIPNVYHLTTGSDISITGLNITLDSSYNINTMVLGD